MDPDEALREIRSLVHEALCVDKDEPTSVYVLAEYVEALDEWLSKGGFLPRPWQAKTDPPRRGPQRDDDYTPAAMDATDPLGPPDPAGVPLPEPYHLGDPDPTTEDHGQRPCGAVLVNPRAPGALAVDKEPKRTDLLPICRWAVTRPHGHHVASRGGVIIAVWPTDDLERWVP